jgi:hypothetical protein
MLRKTMIVLATAAALTGGLTADAFARGGGGGGGGHGGGHGGGFGGGAHMGGGFGGAHIGGFGGGAHFGREGHLRGRRFAPGWGAPYGYYADSGYYDPSTVTADEQPTYPTTAYPYVKPPRSSCSTQTYKVPSEAGGKASINVVRC